MNIDLEFYWHSIPIGVNNALNYDELCYMWGKDRRQARSIMHELSCFDNGDDYILIRSATGRGFFRTNVPEIIDRYKQECLAKGRSNFAPIKKINRVLNGDARQMNLLNNMKAVRVAKGITQPQVVEYMKTYDSTFDVPTLSKLENSAFLPTPYQLMKLAEFYGVEREELLTVNLYSQDVLTAN